MKKETSSSAKATSKPKGNEMKAFAKKKADSNPDTPAIKCTEETCQSTEQVINHLPDQLTNQSVPPVPTDGLIAEQPTAQSISGFPIDVLPAKLQEIVNEANATLGCRLHADGYGRSNRQYPFSRGYGGVEGICHSFRCPCRMPRCLQEPPTQLPHAASHRPRCRESGSVCRGVETLQCGYGTTTERKGRQRLRTQPCRATTRQVYDAGRNQRGGTPDSLGESPRTDTDV